MSFRRTSPSGVPAAQPASNIAATATMEMRPIQPPPACRLHSKQEAWPTIAALSHAPSHGYAGDEQHDEDHHEHEEQDLGDLDRGAGDIGEAQHCGDEADDQEYERPSEHANLQTLQSHGKRGK